MRAARPGRAGRIRGMSNVPSSERLLVRPAEGYAGDVTPELAQIQAGALPEYFH